VIAALSCASADDPCDDMCAAAATTYGTCLEDWGLDWSAAGYEDDADFREVCETWAWEMRILEKETDADGWTDATCAARAELLGTCEDYIGIDWNAGPGDEPASTRTGTTETAGSG